MLSQRERTIPTVPENEDEGAKESLHDSISSESKTPSWDQVKDNIRKAKEQLEQEEGQLSLQRSKTTQNTLVKGFSRSQLQRYINETSEPPPESGTDKARSKSKSKSQLAHIIVTKLWSYHYPGGTTERLKQEGEVLKKKVQKVRTSKIAVGRAKTIMPLLRNHIKAMSIASGARMRIENNEIHATGTQHQINSAKGAIQNTAKTIKTRVISNDSWLPRFLTTAWTTELDGLLSSLSSEYGIHIFATRLPRGKPAKTVHFTVVYPEDKSSRFDLVKQALRLALSTTTSLTSRRSITTISSSNSAWDTLSATPWPSQSLQKLSLVALPNPVGEEPSQTRQFGRLYDSSSPKMKLSSRSNTDWAVKKTIQRVEKSLMKFEPLATSNFEVKTEFSACYGQAVFRMNDPGTFVAPQTERSTLDKYGTFLSQAPLIPQLFSSSKFQASHTFADIPARLLIRTTLIPTNISSGAPDLEIDLVGNDVSAGLEQTLRVVRVVAVHDRRNFLIVRARQATDVQFTRRTIIPLLDDKLETEKRPEVMLASLEHHFAQSYHRDLPFLNINIAQGLVKPRLRDVKTKNKTDKKKEEEDEQEEEKKGVTDSASEATEALQPAGSEFKNMEYVKASVEILDVEKQSMSSTSPNPLSLESSSFTDTGTNRVRQELVLRQIISGSKPADFSSFSTSAFDIAHRIDVLGNQLRHRMENQSS
jgi:hypothetical protein